MKRYILSGMMPVAFSLLTLMAGAMLSENVASAQSRAREESRQSGRETRLPVTFTGGYATNPLDSGRPVALVAGALGVPAEVFRATFRNVTPAAGGREPDPRQVNLNKAALLRGLGSYGVTNERLDMVSDYYRYQGARGEMWRHTSAIAYAIVRDGKVVGFTITNAGAGYTSAPQATIAGMPDIKATVTLGFSTDFKKNGSIKSITLGSSDTHDGDNAEERRDDPGTRRPDRDERTRPDEPGRRTEGRPDDRAEGRLDRRPDGEPEGRQEGRPERRQEGRPEAEIPASMLEKHLGLTGEQKIRLERLVKVMETLRRENFSMQAAPQLKLTDDQIRRIAEGGRLQTVLTAEQNRILAANPKPRFGGPGAPPPPRQ